MPAKDAHVLRVASMERQQGLSACPSPPHHRIAGTSPYRERCPLSSQISQLNLAVPNSSFEMQIAWHLVQSSPYAEEKHFGLASLPLI